MVLKAAGKIQTGGDAACLNVRHLLGLFFLTDLFPSLSSLTHSNSSSLPAPGLSLSPFTTPTLGTSHSVFKHKGEDAWEYTPALRGMLEQAKATPPQGSAKTMWIEKMCQAADMLLHDLSQKSSSQCRGPTSCV